MQEDVENKTLTLSINTAKFTGRTLKTAITMYLSRQKNKRVHPQGKQSVKKLTRQNQGVSSMEFNDPDIRLFDRIARKYGIDYAIQKDRSEEPPKYMIFFKSHDADALTAAFKEFAAKKQKKRSRPSVLAKLQKFKEIVKNAVLDRDKNKDRDLSR